MGIYSLWGKPFLWVHWLRAIDTFRCPNKTIVQVLLWIWLANYVACLTLLITQKEWNVPKWIPRHTPNSFFSPSIAVDDIYELI